MIRFDYGKMFFDSKAVISRVDKATRRVFSRFGAFVRNTARKSIRKVSGKKKLPSRPGQPPKSRKGHLKRFILFGYDAGRRSVVIGPKALGSRPQAPEALEYGGKSRVNVWTGKWEGHGKPERAPKNVHIRARPYMGPAFDKELPQLPQMWRDSVR
ncbi:MAG TPA: hypothetical protein VM487_10910 [Phycisphaerae bacterium]|nr:hypothetical protein [Phycisphaerae bacterium]